MKYSLLILFFLLNFNLFSKNISLEGLKKQRNKQVNRFNLEANILKNEKTEIVYYIPKEKTNNLPAILLLHGKKNINSLNRSLSFSDERFIQSFLRRNIALFFVKIPGIDDNNYQDEYLSNECFQILLNGISKVKELNFINPQKLALVGWDIGSTAAAMLATYDINFSFIICANGIYDLKSQFENQIYSKPYQVWRRKFQRYNFSNQDLIEKSPIFRTNKIKSPICFLHNKNDPIVNISQAENMIQKIKKSNKNAELKILGYGDHMIKRRYIHQTIFEYVEKYF